VADPTGGERGKCPVPLGSFAKIRRLGPITVKIKGMKRKKRPGKRREKKN